MENIYRHQRERKDQEERTLISSMAAAEVNSAIVAATSTNLAAVLPFLFIGGLVGLLFRELIFTISASMMLALTLVPALAGRLSAAGEGRLRRSIDHLMN